MIDTLWFCTCLQARCVLPIMIIMMASCTCSKLKTPRSMLIIEPEAYMHLFTAGFCRRSEPLLTESPTSSYWSWSWLMNHTHGMSVSHEWSSWYSSSCIWWRPPNAMRKVHHTIFLVLQPSKADCSTAQITFCVSIAMFGQWAFDSPPCMILSEQSVKSSHMRTSWGTSRLTWKQSHISHVHL